MTLPLAPDELLDYLMQRVVVTPCGCWLWALNHSGDGRGGNYPRMRRGARWYAVHRLSFATFKGPIPAGMHVHHLCATWPGRDPWLQRLCVNPDHLAAITQSENERAKGLARIASAKSLG